MIETMWHVLALVMSIGFAFLFLFIILLLLQVRDTLKTVEKIAKNIEGEVKPIMHNVGGITGNVEGVSDKANELVGTFKSGTISSITSTKNVAKHFSFVMMNYMVKIVKGERYQDVREDDSEEVVKNSSTPKSVVNHID